MVSAEELKDIIIEKLKAQEAQVHDISGGCGQSFSVLIVSDVFVKKNKLARHRIVNTELKDIISSIHAFTQKTYTVEEWAKEHSN
ncbi:Bol2 protein [Saccharomycopsis crataegensis]|uniref:Bol2 protein n=1 Tax=Saccharomycopsis crataegensis TaxID=43959 RepID=A0AAV5QIK7_9ASCO|nr:Bol2 protein [Saccharomycopsis crataegensis]